MRIGINYPWFNYGWDFGLTPQGWSPRAAWREVIDADFAAFVQSGVELVRWFILADGSGYSYAAEAPKREGLHWRWHSVPAPAASSLDDFSELLDRCRHAHIRLLPVLIDFHWGFPGYDCDTTSALTLRLWRSTRTSAKQLPRGMVKGGRADVFRASRSSASFFSRVLDPFLARSQQYRDEIYAWELINEPEWITRGGGGWLSPLHRVPLDDMLTFLRAGLNVIRGHGFRPSVGFASQGTLQTWDRRAARLNPGTRGMGTELDQFHYYARLGRSAIPSLAPDGRPTALGEFGTRMPGAAALPDLACHDHTHDAWPDLSDQSIATRLRRADSLGFESAFAWGYRSRDCRTGADRAAILRSIAELNG